MFDFSLNYIVYMYVHVHVEYDSIIIITCDNNEAALTSFLLTTSCLL